KPRGEKKRVVASIRSVLDQIGIDRRVDGRRSRFQHLAVGDDRHLLRIGAGLQLKVDFLVGAGNQHRSSLLLAPKRAGLHLYVVIAWRQEAGGIGALIVRCRLSNKVGVLVNDLHGGTLDHSAGLVGHSTGDGSLKNRLSGGTAAGRNKAEEE